MAYVLFNPPADTRKGKRVQVGIRSVLVERVINRGGVRYALVNEPVPALWFVPTQEEE